MHAKDATMSKQDTALNTVKTGTKVALITGASSGIGAGLALRQARKGNHIILMARRIEKLESLAQEIRSLGCEVVVCAADVTDRDAVNAEIERAIALVGPVDLLIANAGMGMPTPAHRFDASTFERVVSVNLVGAANCVAAVIPSMIERGTGQLVCIASLAGYRGLPGSAAYCASKAGMRSFFESLRLDLVSSPITVTTICPGFIKTPMTDSQKLPMPFIMELEPALSKMDRAIERGVAEYAFPFPLSTIVRLARWLPNFMYDRVMGAKARKKN
jgi:short-subunit dehydrogenase